MNGVFTQLFAGLPNRPDNIAITGGRLQIEGYTDISDIDYFADNLIAHVQSESPKDSDNDGLPDFLETSYCTDVFDADTDDDGIPDGDEDFNKNGIVDAGETDPCNIDTDEDGVQDGTEKGVTLPVDDPDGDGALLGTNISVFQPDLDPATRTNPLEIDSDDDGINDGIEDANYNGRVDDGETDPSPVRNKPAIDLDGWGAVSWQTENYQGISTSIKVIDHDGVSEDGSSHQVTMTIGSDSTNEYTLDHQYNENQTTAYYSLHIDQPAITNDYIFFVTDPEGFTSTAVDSIDVAPLKIPINLTCNSGNGTTPIFDWNVSETGTDPTHFRVRIYNPDGSTSHNGNASAPPYQVPPGVLQPNTTYTYRVESRDGHLWQFDVDNNMKSPADNADNPSFTTGTMVSQSPFIDKDDSGLQAISSELFGINPSFYSWFRIHDAQGVPGNIKSVIVTKPEGETFPLHFDYNYDGSQTCGVYTTEKFEVPPTGNYVITVEDNDGNIFSLLENFAGDLLPLITSLNVNLTETQADFSWDPVAGAAWYRVEIFDLNDTQLYYFENLEASLTIPAGFLKKNTSYKYWVKARDQFPENNSDNGTNLTGWFNKPVLTPEPETGNSTPELDFINGYGAYLQYVAAFNIGGVNSGTINLSVGVSDVDGVPSNISKVEVIFPDSITKKELTFGYQTDDTQSMYRYYEAFSDTSGIQEGTYTFNVVDNEGNTSTLTV